jgi:carbamoyl-phosphate synthase large subunit
VEALGKALVAANLLPPPPREAQRIALLSIADRDKHLLAHLATPLLAAGYELVATPGTRRALAGLGIAAGAANPLGDQGGDGTPGIADLIRSGAVALVVNTPSMATGALRDALEIRLAAVEFGVLCLTAMETAVASAEALSVRTSMSAVSLSPIGGRGLR